MFCFLCVNAKVSRLTVDATAAFGSGIFLDGATIASDLTLSHLNVLGGNFNSEQGIYLGGINNDDLITIRDVTVSMTAGDDTTYGIRVLQGQASIDRTRVILNLAANVVEGVAIDVTGFSGVKAVADIRNSMLSVSSSSTAKLYGVLNSDAKTTVVDTEIRLAGGAAAHYGLYLYNASTVTSHGAIISVIGGGGVNEHALWLSADSSLMVARSMLEGNVAGSGALTCVFVYNDNFSPLSGCGP